MSKYKSKRTVVNGRVFDSRKEARRYQELLLLERAGQISDLQMQVPFELIPAQYALSDEVYTKGAHKGERKRGACIEKAVTYKADFFTPIAKAIRLSKMLRVSRRRTILSSAN